MASKPAIFGRVLASVAVSWLGLGTDPGSAQTLCAEPVAPTCLEIAQTYQSRDSTRRCRQDVEDFTAEMQGFEHCLEQSRDRAQRVREAINQRFDCKVEGQDRCPAVPGPESIE